MRNELNVVRSVMGKILSRLSSGRNAMNCPEAFVVPDGTGAPDRKKRGPIAAPSVTPGTLPGLGSGLLPVSAVEPPLEARNAYWTAALISVAFPVASSPLMNAACGAVMLRNVVAPRPVIGIVT